MTVAAVPNPPDDDPRTPPQDVPAEQSVLGAMMLSGEAIADVLEVLTGPSDFYRPAHELIYDAILTLYGMGEPIDAVTVADALERRGEIGRVGGKPYLHTLVAGVPTVTNAGWYARIVTDRAVQRRLVEAGTKIVQIGYSGIGEGTERLDLAEQTLGAVRPDQGRTGPRLIGRLVEPAVEEIEAIAASGGATTGLPTGFTDLDRLTNGLHPGQLVIVAGRPATGKSTLAVDIARSASIRHGHTAAIFSLEMGANELVMRVLSAEARVELQRMRSGNMTEDDWNRVAYKMGAVAEAPLIIDDSPTLTLTSIRAEARRLKQRHDLRLVVVDYLQLLSSGKRAESRQQEVSEFSRSLKLLAKELDVPVIALSQLNRGPEQRSDKRPLMSDLRESGSLEQDADVVILLHREDLHDPDERPGEADFILAKQRNGPTGVVTVAFQGHYSRFVDMAYGI